MSACVARPFSPSSDVVILSLLWLLQAQAPSGSLTPRVARRTAAARYRRHRQRAGLHRPRRCRTSVQSAAFAMTRRRWLHHHRTRSHAGRRRQPAHSIRRGRSSLLPSPVAHIGTAVAGTRRFPAAGAGPVPRSAHSGQTRLTARHHRRPARAPRFGTHRFAGPPTRATVDIVPPAAVMTTVDERTHRCQD